MKLRYFGQVIGLPLTSDRSAFEADHSGATARILRRDFKAHLKKVYSAPVLWSRSYCAISVGGAPLEVVRRYIENQDKPLV